MPAAVSPVIEPDQFAFLHLKACALLGMRSFFFGGMNSVLSQVCLQSIRANKVVLNLATRPLHRLLQNSNLPGASQWNAQLEAPYINRATKLYLYYPQAWWIQQGLTNGSMQYVDAEWPPVNVPIIGR